MSARQFRAIISGFLLIVSAASAQSPPTTGLEIWYKADSLSAGAVATWTDSSGNGRDATQSTSGNRPVATASVVNGLPAVRFDGSNDFLTIPSLNGLSSAEAFVVLRVDDATPSSNNGLWNVGYGSAHGNYYPDTGGAITDCFGAQSLKSTGYTTTPLDQFHIYNASSQSGSWISRINGIAHFATTTNTTQFSASTYRLGFNGGSAYLDGDIAEVLIYSAVLSDADREAVESYLVGRYASIASVPEDPDLDVWPISETQAALAWTPPPFTFVTRYTVERAEGAGGFGEIAELKNVSTFVDASLDPGTEYTYRVIARNAVGYSNYSGEVVFETPTSSSGEFPLDGVAAWFSADSGASGTGVNTWVDLSGASRHSVQTTSANQPQHVSSVLNGRPVLRFDGSNDNLVFPHLNGLSQGDVYAVIRADSGAPGAHKSLWSIGYGISNASYYPNTSGTISDSFGSNAVKATGAPTQDITQFHLYSASSKAGEWTNRINGHTHFRTLTNTTQFTTTANRIGFNLGSAYFDGDIAEVIVFSSVLASGDREAVERYLANKYALVTSAPADPTSLRAWALSSTQLGVAWSSPSGDWVTRYVLQRKETGGGTYEDVADVTSATFCTDSGLDPGTSYTYRVNARNAAGESNWSDEAVVSTLNPGVVSFPTNNVELWVRADSNTKSGTIDFWRDESGSGRDLVQATNANRPTHVDNVVNGRPVVRFDGSNDYLVVPSLSSLSQAEVFAVVKADAATPGAKKGLWSLGGKEGASGYPNASTGQLSDAFCSFHSKTLGSPITSITSFHLFNASSRPNEYIARLNDEIQHSTSSNTTYFQGGGYTLGSDGSSAYFDGDIAEVFVTSAILSTRSRKSVVAYFVGKYGIGDSDTDGLLDSWEMVNFGDLDQTSSTDADEDGLTDLEEFLMGSSPTDSDSDGDSIPDFAEVVYFGTDPILEDTDGDRINDDYELVYGLDPLSPDGLLDQDRDGLYTYEEVNLAINFGFYADPFDPDTNDDGIIDSVSFKLGIDPGSGDSDADGVSNALEAAAGTLTILADTDSDATPDPDDDFPLDPTRDTAPASDPEDTDPPVIHLDTPADLTPIP